jgi:chitinase
LPQPRSSARHARAFLLLMLCMSLLSPAALAAAPAPAPATAAAIVGYVFPKGELLAPQAVAGNRLTRINYAFANIAHGRIVPGSPADAANFATLTALKQQNPALDVLVSVGGWAWSGNFSDMALTPASRAVFIRSVADFLTRYHLDGLDIDWEYPGQPGAGHRFRPQDKQNYTLLLKELRQRLTLLRQQNHHPRPYLLTIADQVQPPTEIRTLSEGCWSRRVVRVARFAASVGKPGTMRPWAMLAKA